MQALAYNTQRSPMVEAEYGRIIHEMVAHLLTITDRAERTKAAEGLIKVMSTLATNAMKDSDNFKQKLWDHLHIMAQYKLDVDCPYPIPEPEANEDRLKRMPYPSRNIKIKHYGKTIEKMIEAAIKMENPERKAAYAETIANFMKLLFKTWNKSIINDEEVISDLKKLSNGKLDVSPNTVLDSLQIKDNVHRHFKKNRNFKRRGR